MSLSIASERRRWFRHGFILLNIGLWLGIATATLPHPRAWLSAHLTAFLTGLVLIAVGLVWRDLKLSDRQRTIATTAGLTSAYLGLVNNVYSAIVGLPGPASQPGVAPPMPEAAIFFAILAIVVPSTLVAFGLALYGLRGKADDQNDRTNPTRASMS